jgi:hypothetical protein
MKGKKNINFPLYCWFFLLFTLSQENWTTGKFGFLKKGNTKKKVITNYIERAMRFAISLFFNVVFSASLDTVEFST